MSTGPLMGLPPVVYVVMDENTLGFIQPAAPMRLNVLAGSVIKGGRDWKNGPTCLDGIVRPATRDDFERFRVSPAGHLAAD